MPEMGEKLDMTVRFYFEMNHIYVTWKSKDRLNTGKGPSVTEFGEVSFREQSYRNFFQDWWKGVGHLKHKCCHFSSAIYFLKGVSHDR